MLTQFLQMVQNGEMQSQLEIARRMGVSPAIVVEIAHELTQRGYLSEYNEACRAQDTNCLSCGVSTACTMAPCISQKSAHACPTRWARTAARSNCLTLMLIASGS